MREIRVVEDPAAVVADRLVAVAEAGGQIALAGGSTPQRAYELAAGHDGDWSGATVWFSDERCVPPDHPDSNFGMADTALLSHLFRPPRVMRIEGELGPDAAAGAYEALVREHLGADPRFDLLLLGLGPDAHTASLFPGKPALEEHERLVAPVPEAGMAPQVPRVTFTLPLINRAREVVFLVAGSDKAQAVARAFGDERDPSAPAGRVDPADGNLFVVLDEPAASALP
jgi:6-phosphogluconolactonase